VWQFAERSIKQVLEEKKIPYDIDVGGAKIYGPAIDVKAVDENGKEWQCMTIQLDMNLPEKWGMSYIGEDGQKHVPIMLHRAILGSIERFIGVYLERCGGKLPVWLSPVQVQILPVSDRHQKSALKIQQKLMENDIRAEVDMSGNTISYQIRNAVKKKIPYIIVLGDKEIENNSISIRLRDGSQINDIPLSDFIKRVSDKIKNKSLDL
jgi:threonyl-tRNA synthetase